MSTAHRIAITAALAALAFPTAAGAQTLPGFTKLPGVNADNTGLRNAIQQAGMPPAVAVASDKYDAEDEVERLLDEHNSRYSWLVFCQQTGSRKYSCRISGWRGLQHARGRVNVTELGGYRFTVKVTAPLRYER